MNPTATASVRPIPLSGIALVLAYGAGLLGYTMFGWALFAAGAFAWMKFDGKIFAKLLAHAAEEGPRRLAALAAYALSPSLALLAYLMLTESQADLVVGCALAFHAILIWGLMLGSAYPVSQDKQLSRRI